VIATTWAALLLLSQDVEADVEIFTKAASWAMDDARKEDLAKIQAARERGKSRADALASRPWTKKKGSVVLGYRSSVDDSVQPFGLIVPASYDPAKPMRLDVVLHGSQRPAGSSELRFIRRFDDGDEGGKAPPDVDYLELHPLGRVENGYRWAGETDVFEAIEAVCRRYAVDRDRVVLRGMSMGASGTWHLGLKHPDRFVALGPYCGYVDTHRFSESPMPNFVKVGALPPHQEKGLRMLDAIDYAANAGVVPAIACMGEKDPFFQAHVIMAEAMEREGLKMVNLISPGTGHTIDPATHKEQMRRIGEFASKGRDVDPRRLRFVTWTLKYGRCFWIDLRGLREHYARAEIEARVADDGGVEVNASDNVTRFALLRPLSRLRVNGVDVPLPEKRDVEVERHEGAWRMSTTPSDGKRPGLQGPVDDAFTRRFLCVRGTGPAWHPAVGAWADAALRRFASEWRRFFRGDPRIKDDTAVTEADLRESNLILFGDPGSNAWIAKAIPKLPIRWSKDELRVGDAAYASAEHAPVLIHPNPLAPDRYLVLNSGHTFHEKELSTLNYLLFPRLGDWAVFKIAADEPLQAGFFDERWRIPAK
jgi:dienelactone hydrolase